MLLRQNGHSRVVGSAGNSVLRRASSALTGATTRKKTTVAIMRKLTIALITSTYRNLLLLIVKWRLSNYLRRDKRCRRRNQSKAQASLSSARKLAERLS